MTDPMTPYRELMDLLHDLSAALNDAETLLTDESLRTENSGIISDVIEEFGNLQRRAMPHLAEDLLGADEPSLGPLRHKLAKKTWRGYESLDEKLRRISEL